ncbi:hypothetical protein NPIL_425681 [Nephila pilipes]|uniref:Uncharacterized protein n=1 Tax=Nephila pilipes TaxID=299642 RepID=A0A8X6QC85_NEPPI|nr:hypothetical protein NPIL_425681 [Nephila pilipes]
MHAVKGTRLSMVRTRPRRAPVRGGSFQPVSALAVAVGRAVRVDRPSRLEGGRLVNNLPPRYRTNDGPSGNAFVRTTAESLKTRKKHGPIRRGKRYLLKNSGVKSDPGLPAP